MVFKNDIEYEVDISKFLPQYSVICLRHFHVLKIDKLRHDKELAVS